VHPQIKFAWLAIPAALSTAFVVFAQGELALRIRSQLMKEYHGMPGCCVSPRVSLHSAACCVHVKGVRIHPSVVALCGRLVA
jgi:hypothetical protein